MSRVKPETTLDVFGRDERLVKGIAGDVTELLSAVADLSRAATGSFETLRVVVDAPMMHLLATLRQAELACRAYVEAHEKPSRTSRRRR